MLFSDYFSSISLSLSRSPILSYVHIFRSCSIIHLLVPCLYLYTRQTLHTTQDSEMEKWSKKLIIKEKKTKERERVEMKMRQQNKNTRTLHHSQIRIHSYGIPYDAMNMCDTSIRSIGERRKSKWWKRRWEETKIKRKNDTDYFYCRYFTFHLFLPYSASSNLHPFSSSSLAYRLFSAKLNFPFFIYFHSFFFFAVVIIVVMTIPLDISTGRKRQRVASVRVVVMVKNRHEKTDRIANEFK